MSYSGEFRNSITTNEDRILKANLIRDWSNGMQHRIPVSATFTLFDFIQVSPSFNYTERWYTGAEKQAWDPIARRHLPVDTIHGFKLFTIIAPRLVPKLSYMGCIPFENVR